MIKSYTGVGSRECPAPALLQLERVGRALATLGFTLRTGGARGADQAFEAGAQACSGAVERFIPWRGFGPDASGILVSEPNLVHDATCLARELHPAWNDLSSGAQKLHARNAFQVLGRDLNEPSQLLICWTPDGAETHAERTRRTGGTGTAISIADKAGVQVFNIRKQSRLQELYQLIIKLS